MTSEVGAKPSLTVFVLRLLAACVVLFATWYLAAKPVSAVTAWMGARIAEMAGSVDRVRQSSSPGRQVSYEVEPDHETVRRHRLPADAVVDVPVNPLKHTFGLPFFLALLVSGRPKGLAWKAVAGTAAVLALAAVGLACDLLVQLGSMQGAAGEPLFAMSGREVIALGFQLGTLVFPTVIPVLLWIALDREALRPYLPARR